MMSNHPFIQLRDIEKRFPGQDAPAVNHFSASIYPGRITGLAGPDAAGKTTVIRLIAGLLKPCGGAIEALGMNPVDDAAHLQPMISYMPQKFGLYEELTVMENLRLYSELRSVPKREQRDVFERLLAFTGLQPFTERRAGALSGGMKQKLGLACALIRKPRILLLDEPGVGVDPISRRELWRMVNELVDDSIAVLWSTAYLDEAEKCETILLMNEGGLLYDGPPDQLTGRLHGRCFHVSGLQDNKRGHLRTILKTPGVVDGVIQGEHIRVVISHEMPTLSLDRLQVDSEVVLAPTQPRFEDAFVDLLGGGPGGESGLADRILPQTVHDRYAVEAHGLTKRFGSFTAANQIAFAVRQGEIFGLLGPNGAGKSTTFKMLCGLLKPTSGDARVAGIDIRKSSSAARAQLGYMAQKFSLYGNLTVRQNLEFFSSIYGLNGSRRKEAIQSMTEIFHLSPFLLTPSEQLPLGYKQRLALACAVMHQPPVLFLDEPTSGVDPITRREFWTHINGMVEKGVTVIVTTHFMDEAEYCDRIALINGGEVIARGAPDDLKNSVKTSQNPNPTMEDAFIELVRKSGAANRAA